MNLADCYIMSKDEITAKWENGELTIINDALLPLFLKRVHSVDLWLETRAIDSHRANSRLLKKALRLRERDDISTVLNVNAATITDTYWIKPLDSDLTYDDVRFSDDYFSELALKGTYDSFNNAANHKNSRTPELTNVGSFEKCWKLIDGKWQMYKQANKEEQFSEVFIFKLGKMLGMNMAEYTLGEDCVISKDFTDAGTVIFEPAFTFMGDNEDYEDVIRTLETLCPDAIKDYIQMIFLDTICLNPDRHTANFGLLREPDTGKIIGAAPCFDHNMALVSRGYPKMPSDNDLLINLFNEVIAEHQEFSEFIPEISKETLDEIAASIDLDVDKEYVTKLIFERYRMIIRQ